MSFPLLSLTFWPELPFPQLCSHKNFPLITWEHAQLSCKVEDDG